MGKKIVLKIILVTVFDRDLNKVRWGRGTEHGGVLVNSGGS